MQLGKHRCAVLGSPIAHSLSPVLHRAGYRRLNLDGWDYCRRDVTQDGLQAFIDSLDQECAGLSLTMPLKKTIMPFGKPSDTWSRALKVANTAIFHWQDGTGMRPDISLYNTDVEGIVRALEHAEGGADRSNLHDAVVIGSGNTAASAIAACAELGMGHVDIVARNEAASARLRGLSETLSMTASTWPMDRVAKDIDERRFVISTLPSHAADPLASLWRKAGMALNATVLDVVYKPRPSMFVETCRQLGAAVITGEEMLIYQAIPQLALMTRTAQADMPSDLDETMRKAVQEALR
ncbi:MAG: shikimate dehydrogenase [Bifidobacterium sp.]|uniref:Shikimate dehydrogenase n=1 Tax=Bifidobacterium fermentum TaxID=3059035 RepID=A0AB39UL30_9BIFI